MADELHSELRSLARGWKDARYRARLNFNIMDRLEKRMSRILDRQVAILRRNGQHLITLNEVELLGESKTGKPRVRYIMQCSCGVEPVADGFGKGAPWLIEESYSLHLRRQARLDLKTEKLGVRQVV